MSSNWNYWSADMLVNLLNPGDGRSFYRHCHPQYCRREHGDVLDAWHRPAWLFYLYCPHLIQAVLKTLMER
jgi:hypothetical protein